MAANIEEKEYGARTTKIDPMKVSPRKRLAMGYDLKGNKKKNPTNTKEPRH